MRKLPVFAAGVRDDRQQCQQHQGALSDYASADALQEICSAMTLLEGTLTWGVLPRLRHEGLSLIFTSLIWGQGKAFY